MTTESYLKSDPLSWAHPLVKEWFLRKFGSPTEPQIQGWPSILEKKSTLISAPTGSGKTFSAFLTCINDLVEKSLAGKLTDYTEILYVSPLKALSNDIQKNLKSPLEEIAQLAKEKGLAMTEIRIAVRTGDTLSKERQEMLKKPPHILVTTPESFFILLTAEKSRILLQTVHTLIVDEIHALANDKRGAHLLLSIERLEELTQKNLLRIGLSATQKPLETVAHFLTGNARPIPTIINIGHARHLELAIEIPDFPLGPVASNEMWDEIYDRVATLANQNRSTLVFVNTRRLSERIAHHLTERLGEHQVAAHHGSLSRKLRLEVENKLKNGELKVLVATASLELGIDIGTIDLVCQIGSPRAIAVGLQRVGRAGHWRGAISKGKIFATTRDELLECSALVYAISQNDLDKLIIPKEPLDILAQQIVAICATGDWHEEKLFLLVKRAFHYADLSRETFNDVLEMLSEGIAASRGRYGAYLFRDKINGVVKARRGSRLIAITSGGAIPDNGLFTVIAEPEGVMVGTLDEDFAVESNRGDIILLGTTSWQVKRIEAASGRVLVEDAHGSPPSVPFWRGEAPARTSELSLHVSELRQKINDLVLISKSDAENWLKENCHVGQDAAQQLVAYITEGKLVLGAVPTQNRIIAERFFDESGGMQLIIHSPFGARINKAWGLALRKKFCHSFNFELQAAATDDGINIALAEQHSFPLADVFQYLHPHSVTDTLVQAVLQSPLFTTRFRWDASRALALVRFRNGKKVPPNLLRMRADDLLAAVFPDAAACQDNLIGQDIVLPDNPLIIETMKDALNEALDVEGLIVLLNRIINQKVECLAVDTPTPSLFAQEILNANPYAFLDDAPLEERRARAVQMRQILPETLLKEIGKLDPLAIKEVQKQAWPDIRNADELHDLLQTLIALPVDFKLNEDQQIFLSWHDFFATLLIEHRVLTATIGEKTFWLAQEKSQVFLSIYPQAVMTQKILYEENNPLERDNALLNEVRSWIQHLGPTTTNQLSQILMLSLQEIEQALIKLETSGLILRGNYCSENEWCERRLLARIHKLTLGKLRKEIEPVTPIQFVRWLTQWQHLQTKLQGESGLLSVIKQLQGFELPANLWEQQIFAKRITDYSSDILDRLCLSGAVGWGRLSMHPTSLSESVNKRISPSSKTPITFFVREESEWMSQVIFDEEESLSRLSHVAKNIYDYLKKRGASFFNDILYGVGHLKAEVENGLWELVIAGVITADSFDNLRSLISKKRRLGNRRGRFNSARFSSGRWALLYHEKPVDKDKQIEASCWVLLKRYGVVFRDLLVREKNIPRWRELLVAFRRLEARGEIRGGRFVDGFLGEQFALTYAVDSLRAIKKRDMLNQTLILSPYDPLNMIGSILPGDRSETHAEKKVQINI